MKYLSVCSGIEAATVAWHPLGWEPVAFSEIEPFPSAVLAHHYPNVPNVGDMTKHKEWNLESVDLLVGGTPCQSFSVAGLRKGLDDPRGNLMLTYLAIADQRRPTWLVWENVPGVLSSNGGKDFGAFLGGLAELGYGFAYRVLDAQYFGVAQRRRRVFVVGHLGDWRAAAAVLFERDSLSGNPAPSREAGKGFASAAGTLTANGGGLNRPAGNANELDFCIPTVGALCAQTGRSNSVQDAEQNHLMAIPIDTMNHIGRKESHSFGDFEPGAPSYTLTKGHSHAVAQPISYGIPGNWIGRKPENGGNAVEPMHDIAPCLTKADQHGVAHPITFSSVQSAQDINPNLKVSQTLEAKNPMAVAFSFDSLSSNSMKSSNPNSGCNQVELARTLDTTTPEPSKNQGGIGIVQRMAVRRLTPRECERLQGFPDDYTAIPWRNSPATNCPDGPRYKALGNSMAVPVMHWIGKRIQEYMNEHHHSGH